MQRIFLVIFFINILCLQNASVYAKGDIYCNSSKEHYDLPGECMRNCKVSLKYPALGACSLSPQCAALGNDENLIKKYNRAIFITNTQVAARLTELIAYIIDKYYSSVAGASVRVRLGDPKDDANWAKIKNTPDADGRYVLTVSQDLFWLSPAMIASSIGHEMIHLIQYKRKTSVNLLNINEAVFAFQELEASTWEIGSTDFNWPIGQNKFFNCLLEGGPERNEKNGIRKALKYREWQVRKKIEDLRELSSLHTGRGDYLKRIEQWLKENPWTNQVWLPQNPDWKNYIAGPKPKE